MTFSTNKFSVYAVTYNDKTVAHTHEKIKIVNDKEATCTTEGYTGDKICEECGTVIEKGKVIPKLSHNYKDGKCTICNAIDPNYKPIDDEDITDIKQPENAENPDVPQTSDDSNIVLWVAMMLISGIGIIGIIGRHGNRKIKS